ncbi:MAG: putative sensor histidine kinase [Peptococcaceae bacterium]|nr:putative sensor histidine kinase [Peptococcaceae bacterium]
MNVWENLKLKDIVDVNTLIDIQDKLAKLVGVPTITVDTYGVPVGKSSNFTPFCKRIRSSEKGRQKCISCDRQAGLLAIQEGKPRIYNCHTGLIDCVAPIIIDNYFLGSVLGGQVLLKGQKSRDSIDIERISRDFDIPLSQLKEAVQYIPLVSQEYLQNSVDFYVFLASYIAQLGMSRLTQERLLKQSKEKFELEQKAKKMELKTIQAQINPHFLFNTLNTIARMALMENAPQTEELIYNLSDLLRYNLKNIEEFPKIKDEIENVKRYLFIQSLRYSDRITYEIDISEAIMDYRIPSMILQPLAENCMVHGLETKKEGGKIEITGRLVSDNEIVIKVSDNGKGIKPEVLNLLQNMNGTLNQYLGIGLQNTHDRIKHYFGDRYGLKIESIPDVETNVYIRIPCVKEYYSHKVL